MTLTDSSLERKLDVNAGRPGSQNPGQQIIREVDSRASGHRALSLHLGVNWVDSTHYNGTHDLFGCLYDAQRMQLIAESYGFVSSTLTNRHATTAALLEYLDSQAKTLVDGDMLFVSYSGHGSNIDELTGDEDDHLDETWCLHDRMLIDDELGYAFSKFESGVRILFVLDSCHSGSAVRSMSRAAEFQAKSQHSYKSTFGADGSSVNRALEYLNGTEKLPASSLDNLTFESLKSNKTHRIRTLRSAEAAEIYLANEDLYKRVQQRILDEVHKIAPKRITLPIKASVLLLAACQDGQVAQEIGTGGLFTKAFAAVLDPLANTRALFDGTHDAFLAAVKQQMNGDTRQTPVVFPDGDFATLFRNQRPFDISQALSPTIV